jgi:hypothetical protein
MAHPPPNSAVVDLETLRAILAAAVGLLAEQGEWEADPLRLRWDRAFSRMPAGDRETVVAAVEREVELRALTAADGEPIVGLSGLRANPNARLYFRVFDGDLPNLHRDEIMLSTLRAARMLSRPDAPEPEVFGEAVRAAFRALAPGERAALARHNRDMLHLLAECDVEASASPAAD